MRVCVVGASQVGDAPGVLALNEYDVAYRGSDWELAAELQAEIALVWLSIDSDREYRHIVAEFTAKETKVVAVGREATIDAIAAAHRDGAAGFITANISKGELSTVLTHIATGGSWICVEMPSPQQSAAVDLSKQETRTLKLYASGMTLQSVAQHMEIAPSTAKDYLDRVKKKYENAGISARTKIELNSLARAEGLIS